MQKLNLTRRTILASIPTVATGTFSMSAAANNETGNESKPTANESTESETETTSASDDPNQVRLTHLAPDIGAVDLYGDGSRAFEGIERHQQSDYKYYEPNATGTVHITPAGASLDDALLESDVELDGGPVSLTLIGEACEVSDRPLQLINVEDNYSEIVSDHARLKAVHASPDAPALDYRTDDGDDLVSGLEFGEYGYSTLTAGKSVIAVHKAGEKEPLFRFEIEPNANSVYSAFAVGYLNAESAPEAAAGFKFALGVVEDTAPPNQ